MKTKILFILKQREDSSNTSYSGSLSTGLWNSSRLVNDMLNTKDIISSMEIAVDNNDIDRLVTKHRPTDVIIEALWVVPSKFAELTRLHPTINWYIRMHSETPFISNEGIAHEWLGQYLKYPNVKISVNSPKFLKEMYFILGKTYPEILDITERVIYLPNYYPVNEKSLKKNRITTYYKDSLEYIDIGCFGATRPLKNQLIQAHAALRFATSINKKLRFHINSNRVESKGDSILKNMVSLFKNMEQYGHELVLHPWLPHTEFLKVIKTLDIGMQISFSETFNIVMADFVVSGIPVLASTEVPWLQKDSTTITTDEPIIFEKLLYVWRHRDILTKLNKQNLAYYSMISSNIWVDYFIKNVITSKHSPKQKGKLARLLKIVFN